MSLDLAPVLGAIHYERDFDINGTLRKAVKILQEKGVRVGGVLQEAELRPDGCCAQLNIVDIRTGKAERITQDRGRDSRGCKLDPRGLAAISHCITDAIDAGVDLVIINKFGRAESEGSGLLSCLADAISADIPVLTTVREPYADAWRSYHGGLAVDLPPEIDTILKWCNSSCPRGERFSDREIRFARKQRRLIEGPDVCGDRSAFSVIDLKDFNSPHQTTNLMP